jgi:hypothetical protein
MKGSFVAGARCLGVLFLVLTTSACASHHEVKCDAHLEPINPAQPKAVPETPK